MRIPTVLKTIDVVDLIEFDSPGANKRIYSKEVVQQAISECVEGCVLGVADIVQAEATNKQILPLDRISHHSQLEITDTGVNAKIKVLDTPAGKIVSDNIDKVVFAPRMTGTLSEPDEYGVVTVSDLTIISVDAVSRLNKA